MTNLNLLFNKIYYSELGNTSFSQSCQKNNNEIFNAVFVHKSDYCPSAIASENGKNTNDKGEKMGTVVLKTVYPGLLIGSGNPHGSHQSDDDINLGFSFDYVSGQPYIPGSSVKGVLRSKFKQSPDAVAAIIETILEIKLGNDKENVIKALETDIFDGKDVFLDAVVFDVGQGKGKLMGADYITPHRSTTNPHRSTTKNPVPVLFAKVLPGVSFEFRFKLYDSVVGEVKISAGKKKHLFKQLLMFFGVGAKTNVGYGVFEELKEDEKISDRIAKNADSTSSKKSSFGPNGNSNPTANSEVKQCKVCGKRIYKYKNGKENFAWKFDTCKDCKDKR